MNETQSLDEMIAGAQSGNPASFDALIDVYSGRLYGYFYRLSASVPDAEDLLQELFVRLVTSIQEYKHQDQFEAFLFRIATNLYRDRLRKLRRTARTTRLEDGESAATPAASSQLVDQHAVAPGRDLESHETSNLLQAALADLPALEREVILLRHYSSMSFRDIADTMGTPIGTALARAHRGLNKLRSILERDQ